MKSEFTTLTCVYREDDCRCVTEWLSCTVGNVGTRFRKQECVEKERWCLCLSAVMSDVGYLKINSLSDEITNKNLTVKPHCDLLNMWFILSRPCVANWTRTSECVDSTVGLFPSLRRSVFVCWVCLTDVSWSCTVSSGCNFKPQDFIVVYFG